jgi:hypothetical protein
MVEGTEGKIPKRNKYTSTILKFKANSKIKNNMAVATMTQNNIPTLEDMAELLNKAQSMGHEEFEAAGALADPTAQRAKSIIGFE